MDGDGDVDITDGAIYMAQENEHYNKQASGLTDIIPTTVGVVGMIVDIAQGDVNRNGTFVPKPAKSPGG